MATDPAWMRSYNQQNYNTGGVHFEKAQRVEPPANVERREFHAPCFRCGARGECEHRRSYANA